MNRINILASLTEGSNIICDVGCDHGYVLIEALKKYNVKRGIAADIAKGPLASAQKNINDNNLSDRITTVLSNGFESVVDDFDTAIIAGMGGMMIINILTESLAKVRNKKLILQANNSRDKLRSFLNDNNFIIEDEKAFYDADKYYEIMVVNTGNMNLTNEEIKYGPVLMKNQNEDFIKFYNNQINMMTDYISRIEDEGLKLEKTNELNSIKEMLKNA